MRKIEEEAAAARAQAEAFDPNKPRHPLKVGKLHTVLSVQILRAERIPPPPEDFGQVDPFVVVSAFWSHEVERTNTTFSSQDGAAVWDEDEPPLVFVLSSSDHSADK